MEDRGVRLQKYLSERGTASRRKAADCIASGRVSVNGKPVTEPGLRVFPERDRIVFDGAIVPTEKPASRTIALHKPRGYICSRRGQNAQTVYALIDDIPEALVPVGRLDKDSEGVLLMSNDGELVQRLTHPRFGHRRTYRVTVSGDVSEKALRSLSTPIAIDGRRTEPCRVCVAKSGTKTGRCILEFELTEGRNRQIRRLCARAGLRVHRLVRVAVGGLRLSGLKPGQWRDVSAGEIELL